MNASYRFESLDGLRGVAALVIAALHMPHLFGALRFPGAYLAVDLFFALSGFVICHAYERRIQQGLSFASFAKARLQRLYPMYLLGILFGTAVALAAIRYPSSGLSVVWTPQLLACSIVPSLVMLPTAFCGSSLLYPLNPAMWSIFAEILVNIGFFLLVRSKFNNTVIYLLIVVASGLSLAIFAMLNMSLDAGFDWSTLHIGLLRVTFSFFAGVIIYRTAGVQRLTLKGVSSLLPPALLALLFCFFSGDLGAGLAIVFVVLPVILLLGAATSVGAPATMLAWLGAASYPLYCIHKPVYQLALGASIKLVGFDLSLLAPVAGIAFLAVLTTAAVFLEQKVDIPTREWLKFIGKRKTSVS